MSFLLRVIAYFAAGSGITGVVFAWGLAHPFSSSVKASDRERAERLGAVKDLDVPPLSGWLIAQPDGVRETIIFIHGRSANRMQMFPVAERFFREGYNVVLWDLPHHGKSPGAATYGRNEVKDVLRVVENVRQEPAVNPDRIFILGFSLGAAISLGAAAVDDQCWIAGVVADSSYAHFRETSKWYVRAFGWIPSFIAWPTSSIMFAIGEWLVGVDLDAQAPRDWANLIHTPTMLIHGERDWRIPPAASREIFDKLLVEKELWLVPNVGHTGAFKKDPATYVRRVREFLSTPKV